MIRHSLLRLSLMSRAYRRRPRGRRAWGLEGLEDRVLLAGPTTYTVNLLGDVGTGTGNSGDIAYVITQVNANTNTGGSLVQFDPTVFSSLQTIPLKSTLEISQTAGPVVIQGFANNKNVVIDGQNTVSDFMVNTGVTAVLSNLDIRGGNDGGDGGGISSDGTLTVANCYIHNNISYHDGGGIANTHTLTVTDSVISSNDARGNGGGISNTGTLKISGTLIDHNTGSNDAGGILSRGGTAAITGTLITANTAFSDGGGIANIDTSLLYLSNSTLDANSADNGGGIENESTLTAVNDTIANNQAGIVSGVQGFGGGLYNAGGTATLDNTIVALNVNVFNSPAVADDMPLPVSSASANNLVGTGGAGGLTGGTNGNQVEVSNPGLGILQNNGGILPTIALLAGSPAIDKGNNALAVDPATGQPLTTDQRGPGFDRIQNGTVDIGAYEFGSAPNVVIQPTIIKVKGHRIIRVIDPSTGAVKFTVSPFGRAYRGQFQVTTVTINGVEDLVVRRPRGHKRFVTKVFSGLDGSLLSSTLV